MAMGELHPSSDVRERVSVQEQEEPPLFGFYEGNCFICNKRTDGSSLYCSDACKMADALSHSPACPPSTGSSAHTSHPASAAELFYQDIPELELELGGSLAFSSSVRKRRSEGKSLSSATTTSSSQSSSPISAPSPVEGEEYHIPPFSDTLLLRSPPYGVRSSPKYTPGNNNHTSQRPPSFHALEANTLVSPTLRPVLRFSRRAYSTNVHNPIVVAPPTPKGHRRTPSGNPLEQRRQPPESAPTSPMLLPHDNSPSLEKKSMQTRSKNRRSLPLSLAPLASLTPHDAHSHHHGETSSPRGANAMMSAGAGKTSPRHGQQRDGASGSGSAHITPSHFLNGNAHSSASDWHPQPYPNSNTHAHHRPHAPGHHRTGSSTNTNVNNSSSNSGHELPPDARERVTSTGTIKRPTLLTSNSSRLGSILKQHQHDSHSPLGHGIGLGRGSVTPPTVASVSVSVSVSASSVASSTFSELALSHAMDGMPATEASTTASSSTAQPASHSSTLHARTASTSASASGSGGDSSSGAAVTRERAHTHALGHTRESTARGRSPRRSVSAARRNGHPKSPERVYHPTFSSSSRSSVSPDRSRSITRTGPDVIGNGTTTVRGRTSTVPNGILDQKRAPSKDAVHFADVDYQQRLQHQHQYPQNQYPQNRPGREFDSSSGSSPRRRASTSARRESTLGPRLQPLSQSRSPLPPAPSEPQPNAVTKQPVRSPLPPRSGLFHPGGGAESSSFASSSSSSSSNSSHSRSRSSSKDSSRSDVRAAPIKVRRQTDGHPERFLARRRLESSERSRERAAAGTGTGREGRGRSREPPAGRLAAMNGPEKHGNGGEERRGRSVMR